MADRYYYCNKGAGIALDVSEASSSQASQIELRVTYTALDRIDVVKALKALEARIEEGLWPPA